MRGLFWNRFHRKALPFFPLHDPKQKCKCCVSRGVNTHFLPYCWPEGQGGVTCCYWNSHGKLVNFLHFVENCIAGCWMHRESQATILFVDDEPSLRQIGEMMLCYLGFDTILAENGYECINIVTRMKNRIDLIILDLVMPGLDGRSTLEELYRRNIEIPVILTTGFALGDLKQGWGKLGLAQAIITKPFDMEKLRAVIKEILFQ